MKPVLVDLEDCDLGQVSDRVGKVLNQVLAQVKVCQVGLKKDSNITLSHFQLRLIYTR